MKRVITRYEKGISSPVWFEKGKKKIPYFLIFGGFSLAGFLIWFFALRSVKPKSMPVTLPSTVRGFVLRKKEAVDVICGGLSDRTKAMIIAHAAYESGYGKAKAFKEANNPFNLTTLSTKFVLGPDTDASGNPITQKWAVFDSLEEGTQGYLRFIQASRYTDSYNRLINGDVGFLDSLYRGGYFTLALPTYKSNYLSVLSRVQQELSSYKCGPLWLKFLRCNFLRT